MDVAEIAIVGGWCSPTIILPWHLGENSWGLDILSQHLFLWSHMSLSAFAGLGGVQHRSSSVSRARGLSAGLRSLLECNGSSSDHDCKHWLVMPQVHFSGGFSSGVYLPLHLPTVTIREQPLGGTFDLYFSILIFLFSQRTTYIFLLEDKYLRSETALPVPVNGEKLSDFPCRVLT